MDTYWYYKNAHTIDQKWSVRACGVRQRHIDQAQSVNLYITNEYTLRQVLELYVLAWGVRRQDRNTNVRSNRWRWRNARAAPPEAALCGRNGQEEQRPRTGAGRGERAMEMLAKKPLFNPDGDTDVRLRRMIGGNTTNLNDFNNMRYSWVSGWYRQAMNNFWIPEEISLAQDVKDYPRLDAAERTAYDKILSFLVFLDSIQTANLPNLGEYITANEVNLCLNIQTFQEMCPQPELQLYAGHHLQPHTA